MSEWQPIETAPKNAIIDLLFRGNVRFVDCIWYGDEWWTTEQGDPSVCLSNNGAKPTHWMHLPAMPKGAAKAEKA